MCNNNIDDRARQVADAIRGSLMAGAAGDALGYEVEFMSRHSILARFGGQGITRFALDSDGKALISDDTQMSLFTANGMLTGLTRGKMCGMATRPEDCVEAAYVDWYYTQTGMGQKDDSRCTWLRDLSAMIDNRIVQPGISCTSQPSKREIWTVGSKSKPNERLIMWWMGIMTISKRGGFSIRR